MKRLSELLGKIMTMEFLAKYLLAWGIGINILIASLLLGKIIIVIAGL